MLRLSQSRPLPVILFTFAVLFLPVSARAQVQWSTPLPIAPETAASIRQAGHSMDARDGSLWVTWVDDQGSGPYYVKGARFEGEAWTEPQMVASLGENPYAVEMAVDASLRPWVTWTLPRNARQDTYYSYSYWSRREGDTWTHARLMTADTLGLGGEPGLAPDPLRGIWATWSMGNGESMAILSSYCQSDSWTPPASVARFIWWSFPYVPAMTTPAWGKVRSVWTGALPSGLGVYSATWAGDTWETPVLIPRSALGKWPSVCSDSSGRTWVTWLDEWSSEPTVRCARNDGVAWTDTWEIAIGNVNVGRGALCCDESGRPWSLWTDYPNICVSYCDGDSWSVRSIVASADLVQGSPRICSALGRIWVTWTQRDPGNRRLLYYSHTLPSGVGEGGQQWKKSALVSPTLVRRGMALQLAGLLPGQTAQMLDVIGGQVGPQFRRASEGATGLYCSTTSLSPGVYFVRISGSGQYNSRKVVIVRGH